MREKENSVELQLVLSFFFFCLFEFICSPSLFLCPFFSKYCRTSNERNN